MRLGGQQQANRRPLFAYLATGKKSRRTCGSLSPAVLITCSASRVLCRLSRTATTSTSSTDIWESAGRRRMSLRFAEGLSALILVASLEYYYWLLLLLGHLTRKAKKKKKTPAKKEGKTIALVAWGADINFFL